MLRLHEKVILITSAGSPLGRQIALLLACQGAYLMLTDADADSAELTAELVAGQGATAAFGAADPLDTDQIDAIARQCHEKYERLNGLIHLLPPHIAPALSPAPSQPSPNPTIADPAVAAFLGGDGLMEVHRSMRTLQLWMAAALPALLAGRRSACVLGLPDGSKPDSNPAIATLRGAVMGMASAISGELQSKGCRLNGFTQPAAAAGAASFPASPPTPAGLAQAAWHALFLACEESAGLAGRFI